MLHRLTAKTLACLLMAGVPATLASAWENTDIKSIVQEAMAGDHRNAAHRARDDARHPAQTLAFMGWRTGMTVVEIWPSSGWYTEILAPITREDGIFYAANFAPTADRTPRWRKREHKRYMEKLEAQPAIYNHVVATPLAIPERTTIAPPGSADMVLTFRNVHNWMKGGYAPAMFDAMARALRPGGVLGVVEHRAPPGTSVARMKASGYVTERHVIALAQSAGLSLEARSEINANPRDDHDHPAGVWTLPPTLRHCGQVLDNMRRDCKARYRAIGESDRMTLRFRKTP
ncbi:MAG: class I SAM-dependent methyltransferase [Algiphilus sp.]